MKPIITVYSGGSTALTKKFDNFVHAAYWIGIENAERDLESVKVRVSPLEDYDADVANAKGFSSLLIENGINFSFEFFVEPPQSGQDTPPPTPPPPPKSSQPTATKSTGRVGSKATPENLKSALEKGLITKREYDSLMNQG
ncbi:MAG: hypothetical protein ABSB29_07720 [Nitrososphaerales archaeon]|jgi:hypothetical protein